MYGFGRRGDLRLAREYARLMPVGVIDKEGREGIAREVQTETKNEIFAQRRAPTQRAR